MLAVVHDENGVAVAHTTHDHLDDVTGQIPLAERGRDRCHDASRVDDPGELDEPRAAVVTLELVGRELQREPRLPASARTIEREQPRVGERGAESSQLGGAADERRELHGKVVWQIVERCRRSEPVRQVGMAKLEDVLRAAEILERVRAEVGQRRTVRQPSGDDLGRGSRDQYLATRRE